MEFEQIEITGPKELVTVFDTDMQSPDGAVAWSINKQGSVHAHMETPFKMHGGYISKRMRQIGRFVGEPDETFDIEVIRRIE